MFEVVVDCDLLAPSPLRFVEFDLGDVISVPLWLETLSSYTAFGLLQNLDAALIKQLSTCIAAVGAYLFVRLPRGHPFGRLTTGRFLTLRGYAMVRFTSCPVLSLRSEDALPRFVHHIVRVLDDFEVVFDDENVVASCLRVGKENLASGAPGWGDRASKTK